MPQHRKIYNQITLCSVASKTFITIHDLGIKIKYALFLIHVAFFYDRETLLFNYLILELYKTFHGGLFAHYNHLRIDEIRVRGIHRSQIQ